MNKRLLLVEDEEHLAFTLEFNLQEEGYAVDVASSLGQARALMRTPYDLIVLDVMLPDGNGVAFCASLRAQGDHTPILMLTAKGTSDDIVTGLDAGADDYMTKPFALQELLGRIAAMLRRRHWDLDSELAPSTSKENLFVFGDFVVDFDAHEVRQDDRVLDVTELELRLLRFFIDNQNKAIARQTLLSEVWHVSGANNTRTVDNFLVRLRRLFEQDPARPAHFLTVRGIGYRFVPNPEQH